MSCSFISAQLNSPQLLGEEFSSKLLFCPGKKWGFFSRQKKGENPTATTVYRRSV